MNIIDRFRKLFESRAVSEEEKDIFTRAKTTSDLIRGFEEAMAPNSLELKERERQIDQIEATIGDLGQRLIAADATPTQKDRLNRQLDRLENDRRNVDRRLAILHYNIVRLQMLIGRIMEIEARQLAGVTEDDIDAILERADEELQRYARLESAAERGDVEAEDRFRLEEKARHAERERRLREQAKREPDVEAGARVARRTDHE